MWQVNGYTSMQNFIVTILKKNPAYDERAGITYRETAKDKATAIRRVRHEATMDGHIGQGQGCYSITATVTE